MAPLAAFLVAFILLTEVCNGYVIDNRFIEKLSTLAKVSNPMEIFPMEEYAERMDAYEPPISRFYWTLPWMQPSFRKFHRFGYQHNVPTVFYVKPTPAYPSLIGYADEEEENQRAVTQKPIFIQGNLNGAFNGALLVNSKPASLVLTAPDNSIDSQPEQQPEKEPTFIPVTANGAFTGPIFVNPYQRTMMGPTGSVSGRILYSNPFYQHFYPFYLR